MASAPVPDYLTASDLASLADVDLKTIHNWTKRGKIPFFRTLGRHLRFFPADVVAFLDATGYAIPDALRARALAFPDKFKSTAVPAEDAPAAVDPSTPQS